MGRISESETPGRTYQERRRAIENVWTELLAWTLVAGCILIGVFV